MSDVTAEQLVDAALIHVPFDGWQDSALEAAASDLGLPAGDWRGLLPGGVEQAVDIYLQAADAAMLAGYEALEPAPTRIHEKIRALILLRLEQAMPHKETVRLTVNWLGKPQRAQMAARQLYRTVDGIWRIAGDTATDFSFYSKRATLAAVYSSTLLAFISDDTPDMSKTKAFLDRRLQDVARIPKMTAPAKTMAAQLSKTAQAVAGGFLAKGPFGRGFARRSR